MPENITFQKYDKFNCKPFADRLTKIVSTFYPFYDEAYVLSLNARFGSGKSTFLQMWKQQLKDDGYQVVSINAWDNDFDDAAIMPIIGAFLDELKMGNGFASLKSALETTVGATALAANGILSHTTGINVKDIMEGVENDIKQKDLKKLGNEIYREYNYKKNAYSKLRSELQKYVEKQDKKPIIVMVDELDRCRPDYSVKFLEAIKHVFSISGLCFILAVDKDQLSKSVKQLYGDIDFDNYYRKFITREANLPSIERIDLVPFVHSLVIEFFDEKRSKGVSFPFRKADQPRIDDYISKICKGFDLNARQIISLFRTFSQFSAITEKTDLTIIGSWIEAALFLIATSIDNYDMYERIGKNSASADDILEYITSKNIEPEFERYLISNAFAFAIQGNTNDEQEEFASLFMQYETEIEDLFEGMALSRPQVHRMFAERRGQLSGIHQGSVFRTIYNKLEDWRPFLEA